jgi:hypothetical protein
MRILVRNRFLLNCACVWGTGVPERCKHGGAAGRGSCAYTSLVALSSDTGIEWQLPRIWDGTHASPVSIKRSKASDLLTLLRSAHVWTAAITVCGRPATRSSSPPEVDCSRVSGAAGPDCGNRMRIMLCILQSESQGKERLIRRHLFSIDRSAYACGDKHARLEAPPLPPETAIVHRN